MEVEKGRGSEWSRSVLQNMTDDCVPFSFQCFQFYNRKDRMTKLIVSNWMALASALDSPCLGVLRVVIDECCLYVAKGGGRKGEW